MQSNMPQHTPPMMGEANAVVGPVDAARLRAENEQLACWSVRALQSAEALQAQNAQLQQQVAAMQVHCRSLHGNVRVSKNQRSGLVWLADFFVP